MRILVTMLLSMAFLLTAFAANQVEAGGSKTSRDQTAPSTVNDLFPWPWGSECPFPWRNIEGAWRVQGETGSAYNGHYMIFGVQKEDNGVQFIEIAHYDRRGHLRSTGTGFSEEDKRVVKGVMTLEQTGKNFVVMVRSYSKGKSCRASDLVSAITFCPLRGKKCMEDQNYVLERVELEAD